MSQPKLSAFVVTLNEEKFIRRAVESLLFCDEIIIVDCGSTDKTLDICHELGAKVIHEPWRGFVGQKQFALEQCSGDWVLSIDADEVVTPGLQEEILKSIKTDSINNGYELLRVTYFLGRFWRTGGWYPEYRLRVVRRSAASWGGEEPHDRACVAGAVKRLRGELEHYTYRSIEDQIHRLNKYSSIGAKTLKAKRGKFSLFNLLLNPLARFCKFYFFKGGWREGVAGLYVAVAESIGVFLKYAKVWELEQNFSSDRSPPE